MAGKTKLVDDLVEDVRSLMDEENKESVNTDEDILPALNRAQDFATNILARQYDAPLLRKAFLTTSNGQKDYNIPDDAFEQRLEKVEVEVSNLFYPVARIDFRNISLYETQGATSIPYYYCVIGDKFRILPTSNGNFRLRIWYLRDPLPLVQQQGRITKVTAASNYVNVDSVGTDLSTESDNLNSFVNLIDGQSGKIKATMQIKSIDDNRITFKTVPSRTTVYNQTVDTDLSMLTDDDDTEATVSVSIDQDDYICLAEGVCIPYLKKPLSNFLVQYATAEMRRKLGGSADLEETVLKKFEQQVERLWVGQESNIRVTKRNDKWDLPIRRYWGINR